MADGKATGASARPRSTLVVITGHSGAGKSEAIAAFEDGGYFCVDNLPPRMIGSLGELFRHEGSGVERAAVVSDVRGGDYFDDLLQVLDELEADGLEAEGALPRGRRGDAGRPLQGDPPPPPAGAGRADRRGDPRRARAAGAAARARRRGDGHQRPDRRRCCGGGSPRRCSAATSGGKLALTLLTFGFKNGPPRDADLTLDVRFLPNPHYVDELRPLTGLDAGGARVRRVRRPRPASSTAGCCRCSSSSSPPTSPRARAT